jgi:hypothetical protein
VGCRGKPPLQPTSFCARKDCILHPQNTSQQETSKRRPAEVHSKLTGKKKNLTVKNKKLRQNHGR